MYIVEHVYYFMFSFLDICVHVYTHNNSFYYILILDVILVLHNCKTILYIYNFKQNFGYPLFATYWLYSLTNKKKKIFKKRCEF